MKSPQEILKEYKRYPYGTDKEPHISGDHALNYLYELMLGVIGEDEYQSNFQTRIYQVPEGFRELHVPVSEPITRNVFRAEQRKRLNELFGREK